MGTKTPSLLTTFTARPVNVAPVLVTRHQRSHSCCNHRSCNPAWYCDFRQLTYLRLSGTIRKMLGLLLGVRCSPAMIAVIAANSRSPVFVLRSGMAARASCSASAALAWDGFRYLFSSSGVEIRALGFRLRSIPAGNIKSYAPDHWNVSGGYGIRGVGDKRAYVWGNRGVLIKTLDGEVFLGHKNPEKIIRDLDLLARNHEAQGAAFSS